MADYLNFDFTSDSTDPITLSYTPASGDNAKMVIMVGGEHGNPFNFKVTVDGVSATAATTYAEASFNAAQIYYDDNISAGQTVSIEANLTGGLAQSLNGIVLGAVTVTGVRAGDPDHTDTTAVTTGLVDFNLDLSGRGGESVVFAVVQDSQVDDTWSSNGRLSDLTAIANNSQTTYVGYLSDAETPFSDGPTTVVLSRGNLTSRTAIVGAVWRAALSTATAQIAASASMGAVGTSRGPSSTSVAATAKLAARATNTHFGAAGIAASANMSAANSTVTSNDEWFYWAPDSALGDTVPAGDGLPGGTEDATNVVAVPTIHSCGFEWPSINGGGALDCEIQYKPDSETVWRIGQNLYWDDFPRAAAANQPPEQYLGSIVHLKPGTAYTARLKIDGTFFKEVSFTTWQNPEDLPIGTTTEVPDQATTLTITAGDSGTAGGYHKYVAATGGGTIDVANAADYCIIIEAGAEFIFIEGLTLIGASVNGIYLKNTSADFISDIVIRKCDISDWGDPGVGGFGNSRAGAISNEHSAINERHNNVRRLIIDRNVIHDPRFSASAWDEFGGTDHPQGPQPTWIATPTIGEGDWGNHVIRYNHIYGDGLGTKRYNDGLSGGFNDSPNGYVSKDSDLYGNIIRECWDDGIEVDGGMKNVRIWGNYLDQIYIGISSSPVHLGPLYIFRNLADTSRFHKFDPQAPSNGGAFHKMQSQLSGNFGFGRVYDYNNTVYQRAAKLGHRHGTHHLNVTSRAARDHITRNNIFEPSDSTSLKHDGDAGNAFENDFDYDYYENTTIGTDIYTGAEANGIDGDSAGASGIVYLLGEEDYDPTASQHDWRLDPTSSGYQRGEFLPGFTLNAATATPDMGAHESGTVPIEVGPLAWLTPQAPEAATITATSTMGARATNIHLARGGISIGATITVSAAGKVNPLRRSAVIAATAKMAARGKRTIIKAAGISLTSEIVVADRFRTAFGRAGMSASLSMGALALTTGNIAIRRQSADIIATSALAADFVKGEQQQPKWHRGRRVRRGWHKGDRSGDSWHTGTRNDETEWHD